PGRVPPPHRQNRLPPGLFERMRTAVRGVAARRQRRGSARPPPLEHHIARLAADPELTAQLRHRHIAPLVKHAEPNSLVHGTGLPERHRSNLLRLRAIPDLLPILPVQSVTHHAGSNLTPTLSPPETFAWLDGWRREARRAFFR